MIKRKLFFVAAFLVTLPAFVAGFLAGTVWTPAGAGFERATKVWDWLLKPYSK